MRRAYALGVAAALLALVVVSTAAAMTPKQLYAKLLTTSYTPTPSGYYEAKVGSSSLDNRMKRHHAVGAVQVTLGSDAAVFYLVFRSSADVMAFTRDHNYDNGADVESVAEMGKVAAFAEADDRDLAAIGEPLDRLHRTAQQAGSLGRSAGTVVQFASTWRWYRAKGSDRDRGDRMSRTGWMVVTVGAVVVAMRSERGRRARKVYIEEVSSGSKPIEAVGTAIAAFVGPAPEPPPPPSPPPPPP